MRLLAVCVVFRPEVNVVVENILRYVNDVDRLVIWDNTPGEDDCKRNRQILKNLLGNEILSKVVFKGSGENVGLSRSYNECVDYARREGFTHIMTMDQDSVWTRFRDYRDFAELYFRRNGDMAILGPAVNEEESVEELKSVPNIINSGAMIPVAVFDRIGGYCERFLVDAVDVELCYRGWKNGIPTYAVFGHGHLSQRFGNMTYFRFNGRQWHCTNYSPFRLRGIVRNHTLVARNYPEQPDNLDRLRNVYLKQYTIAILLKENNKFRKLFAIYRGLIEGLLTSSRLSGDYSKA